MYSVKIDDTIGFVVLFVWGCVSAVVGMCAPLSALSLAKKVHNHAHFTEQDIDPINQSPTLINI